MLDARDAVITSEVPAVEEGTVQGDSPGVGLSTRCLHSFPRSCAGSVIIAISLGKYGHS